MYNCGRLVVFRRNPCTLKIAALAVTTVRIESAEGRLVHIIGHTNPPITHGIQHQRKDITTNALKTTSKG